MKKILAILLLTMSIYADQSIMDNPEIKNLKYVNSVMKVYSQTIKWEHPKWPAIYRKQSNGAFIIEFIPKNQKLDMWKDMLTVQGLKGLSNKQNLTPRHIEYSLANKIKNISPNQLVFKELYKGEFSGYEGVMFLLGLKEIPYDIKPELPKGNSEMGLYLVVKGKNDFYIIHRSWKGEKMTSSNLPFSKEELAEWFDILKKIEIY